MNKIIGLFLGVTKVGKKVVEFFDGKKAAIASFGTALAGSAAVINTIAQSHDIIQTALSLAHDPAVLATGVAWAAFFQALKGEKIRAQNDEIIEKLDKNGDGVPD